MRRTVVLVAVMAAVLVMASGVALAVNKVGTNGPDTLRGTNEGDNLLGRGGQDDLFGLGGNDNLLGGEGRDVLLGGNERVPQGGDKNLVGGPGNDLIFGGNGSDNLTGGEGNDLVNGGLGSDNITGDEGTDLLLDGEFRRGAREDTLSGGPGNDFLAPLQVPASRDVVVCGRGFDRVLADRKDRIAPDCEKVFLGLDSQGAFFRSIPRSFDRGLPPFPGE
jgi:Ca2+-binding RTX toxin-like protein